MAAHLRPCTHLVRPVKEPRRARRLQLLQGQVLHAFSPRKLPAPLPGPTHSLRGSQGSCSTASCVSLATCAACICCKVGAHPTAAAVATAGVAGCGWLLPGWQVVFACWSLILCPPCLCAVDAPSPLSPPLSLRFQPCDEFAQTTMTEAASVSLCSGGEGVLSLGSVLLLGTCLE